MKNWIEICNKNSKLMKEFREFWYDEKENLMLLEYKNIKDIWGYLICFAETKGYDLSLHTICGVLKMSIFKQRERITVQNCDNPEQAMLWCIEKFFE